MGFQRWSLGSVFQLALEDLLQLIMSVYSLTAGVVEDWMQPQTPPTAPRHPQVVFEFMETKPPLHIPHER